MARQMLLVRNPKAGSFISQNQFLEAAGVIFRDEDYSVHEGDEGRDVLRALDVGQVEGVGGGRTQGRRHSERHGDEGVRDEGHAEGRAEEGVRVRGMGAGRRRGYAMAERGEAQAASRDVQDGRGERVGEGRVRQEGGGRRAHAVGGAGRDVVRG